MRKPTYPPHGPPPAAFTLVEVIGALALMAVVVGTVAYSSLAKVSQSHQQREAGDLATFARAFERAVIRTRTIPQADGWIPLVAGELSLSQDQVRDNFTGQRRQLLLDPELRLGVTATNILPYLQTANGSVHPTNLRAVLVSSLAGPLPTLDGDDFASLWDATGRAVPSALAPAWKGQVDDLRIERIDFGRLFRHVILNNLDGVTAAPYGMDGTNVVTIPPRQRVEGWFFETSAVNLYYGSGILQARESIARDTSYVYENGRWGRSVIYGAGAGSTSLGELTEDFINLVTFNNTAADDPATSDTSGVIESSATTETTQTTTITETTETSEATDSSGGTTTTTTTTKYTKVKNNNGHGNNVDGVDVSNPGQGGGGPNGAVDPSGTVDDEKGSTAGTLAYGTTSRDVVDACHRFMKSYAVWSMKGRPVGGSTPNTRHPAYRAVIEAREALSDYTYNLAHP